MFAKISGAEHLKVRFEVVTDNKCLFWHQDAVPYRLVTTYHGPCTEYVEPAFSQTTLRDRKVGSPHAKSLTHHDVAIWKGSVHSSRIVHRSPWIEGTGAYRMVLVLDVAHCPAC